MAFTASELASIANAALDFHFKGQPLPQSIQDKPLLAAMESGRKTFPGGKGDITYPVKGRYEFEGTASGTPPKRAGDLKGFTHNDQVAYGTLAGIERVKYPWREMHTGWGVTMTELKIDGISVNDSAFGKSTSNHSKREMTAITNIMQDKVETFAEIVSDQMNDQMWGDGTTDPLGFLGLKYFLKSGAGAATGTTGGIDRATNAWWRNRTKRFTAGTIATEFHTEWRQLRRYGGRPSLFLCGSDFLDALVTELHAKGQYTQQGWSSSGATDITTADVAYSGNTFRYDPTLDDLGESKFCYVIDPRRVFMYAMESEWGKDHNPARPHDVYAIYKARTFTGQMIATQLNCHGVYDIA